MPQLLRTVLLAVIAAMAAACVTRPVSVETATPPPSIASASPDVADRIRRVESGLSLMHVVRGETRAPMTVVERMRYHNVPGVSIAVVNEGRIEWARAYGEIEAGSGVAVDTLTLFQAASISKPVSAAGVMKLVEEGVLSLDEDVNKWLRSWAVPGSAHAEREKVTLRRLLSHTAGTTVHGFPGYAATATVPTLVQVLNGEAPANTKPIVVDTQPGALFRYSGGGTTIAQLVVAEVTGRPFGDVLREKVLVPAGMTRSAFAQPLPDELRANAATAHNPLGQPIPGKYHTYPELAAAGLWTTPSDLARFGIEIQRALAGDRGRILSPETARAMVTQQTPASGGRYGIGFGLEGPPDSLWFAHGGSNAGFQAYFLMSADRGQGAVIMTNGALGSPLMQEIMRSVAREYGWGRHQAVEKEALQLDSAALAAFVGTYATPPGAPGNAVKVEIVLEGGQLFANVPVARWTQRPMRASAPDKFFFLASPGEFIFERDAAGAVTGLTTMGVSPQPIKLVKQGTGPANP